MDPALAIPLHFSLEFVGVAAFGGLVAWAVHRRAWVLGSGAVVLLAAQVVHTGQFVSGEDATSILALRLAGLAATAVGVRLELGADEPDTERAAPQAAAAGGGVQGLAFATAALGVVVAVGHRDMKDRRLWGLGWAGVAGAELWLAVAGTGPSLLTDDLGLHLVRALGFVLLAAWAWRRTESSLSLRMLGAFALVLFVVIAVAGSAVARVTSESLTDQQLDRLEVQALSQEELFEQTNEDLLGRAALAVTVFTPVLRAGEDPTPAAQRTLESDLLNADFIVVVGPDRQVRGQAGMQEPEIVPVSGSEAVTEALEASPVPVPSLERLPDELVFVAAAPVYESDQQTPENVIGVVVLGRRFGAAATERIEQRVGDELVLASALVAPGGNVLAASEDDLRSAEVPQEALEVGDGDVVWRGIVRTPDRRYLAAATSLERADASSPAILLLASPDRTLAQAALDVSRALFASVLAATLIAVLIALWLASRITRPVMDLTGTARRVEEGDLEARSTVRSGDEIGTLARAFDSMTSRLGSTLAAERDTRQRLETIVSGMGEGLVAMDPDFNIVSFNEAAAEIVGVDVDDALGKKCYDVYGHGTSGPDGAPICDYICPLRHDGGVDGGVALTTADDRTLAVAVTCSTLTDPDGEIVGGVDLLRDVTPEMEAEQMKSNFLSNISHELRTPLTPIKAYALQLVRKDMPRDKALNYLEEIVKSSQRLERIVGILVDMAAFEAGRLEPKPKAVRPGDLVKETVTRWRDRVPDRKLKAAPGRSLPEVWADPGLISKALDELVDNAVKFSPDGGTITVQAREERGGIRMSVNDKGIGIEAEDLESLFDAFVQADPTATRRFGGLGVGLPFAQRILDGHDTELDAESTPGKGSTFSFVLPKAGRRRRKKRS